MANRDVCYVNNNNYKQVDIDFKWYPGFAKVQKQRSIKSLHNSFNTKFPKLKVIEISSASENEVGIAASAFNLKMKTTHGIFTVEQLFQSAKVFNKSGVQTKSLYVPSKEAKRNSYKLSKNENLIGFDLFGIKFPLVPKTLFYDWLYLNALLQNQELAQCLLNYDAFTDINVKPNYTINSQAKSCAIFVFLMKRYNFKQVKKLLKVSNINTFVNVVYGVDIPMIESSKSIDSDDHGDNDQSGFKQTELF